MPGTCMAAEGEDDPWWLLSNDIECNETHTISIGSDIDSIFSAYMVLNASNGDHSAR